MESRIRYLIEKALSISKEISKANIEINLAVKYKKRGKAQQLYNSRKYLYRKLYSLRDDLSNIIHGTVCNVSYTYKLKSEENIYQEKALLVNLNDQEINDALKLYCDLNNRTLVKILEIQRIPTKLG